MSNQHNEALIEAAMEKAEEEGKTVDFLLDMDLEEVWEYLHS